VGNLKLKSKETNLKEQLKEKIKEIFNSEKIVKVIIKTNTEVNTNQFSISFKGNKLLINSQLTYKDINFRVKILLKDYNILTITKSLKQLQNLNLENYNNIEINKKDINNIIDAFNLEKIKKSIYIQERGIYSKEKYFMIPDFSSCSFYITNICSYDLENNKNEYVLNDREGKLYLFDLVLEKINIIKHKKFYTISLKKFLKYDTTLNYLYSKYLTLRKEYLTFKKVEYYYIKEFLENEQKIILLKIPNREKYRKLFNLD
jgi:hypothetical protein